MLQAKQDQAMTWVWDYAACSYLMGASLPTGTSITLVSLIGPELVDHLTAVYYGNTTDEKEREVINTLKGTLNPMCSALYKDVEHSWDLQHIIAEQLKNLPTCIPMIVITGVYIMPSLTITLGWGLTKLLNALCIGKIKLDDVKSEVESEEFKNELRQVFKETLRDIRNDPRFAMDRFGSDKK